MQRRWIDLVVTGYRASASFYGADGKLMVFQVYDFEEGEVDRKRGSYDEFWDDALDGFLAAERNLLQEHGWVYARTRYWTRPAENHR